MKKQYRYILEPYKGKSSRYKCPHCGANRSKTFVRYVDTYTGLHVAYDVGKCDRDDNCGYHYTPQQYFKEHGISPGGTAPPQEEVIERPVPVSFIPNDVFKQSLTAYDTNNFVKYLHTLFDAEIVSQLIAKYFLGSTIRKHGGVIFWQVDAEGNIRTGKIIHYNPETGKRLKEPDSVGWVHSQKYDAKHYVFPDFNLHQCFFGEHLLKEDSNKDVAIVESEKTAIIASVYLPQFIWIATGGKYGLNDNKYNVLNGRRVVLFPDINAYSYWKGKATELLGLAKVEVSDLLERLATETERRDGLDLADFLVKIPLRDFLPQNAHTSNEMLTNPNISTRIRDEPDTLFNYIVQSEPELKQPLNKREMKAFIGRCGKLYIRQPDCPNKYAVYESIEAYNKRLHLPYYENELFVMHDFMALVRIDFNRLKVE
jgi:hypothetical protein